MRFRSAGWVPATAAFALLACGAPPHQPDPSPVGRELVLASFTAEVDAALGTFTIRSGPAPTVAGALTVIPWVIDGSTGSGPPDTVELVTEGGAGAVADGCAPGVSSYEANVRLRSFYGTSLVRNAHVEITGMTATGFEGCDSAFPAPEATTRAYGLFPYGTLTRAGTEGDSRMASWKFRYPSATSFTMWGHVVGEVIAAAPPTVTATVPANGQTANVGSVSVTFSEPMDIARTAAAISLSGPEGTVAGSVSSSTGGQVFTFTPSTPLAAATTYTLHVSTAAVDPLEATLAETYTSTFTTKAQQLSGEGWAAITPGGITYDKDGNGLAVWNGRGLLYSYYSAASGTWSEPAVLDSGGSPRVAASTTQFAVLWRSSVGLRVAIFSNGIPGAPTTLATAFIGHDHAIASNGSGFAAVWSGTNQTYSSIWDDTAWTSKYVCSDSYADLISVAAEGSGYRAVWNTGTTLRSARYDGASWKDVTTLGSAGTASRAALASSPAITCIAWQSGGSAQVRVEHDGVAKTTSVLNGMYTINALSVGAIGTRCQVAAATSDGVFGASYDGAAWTTTSVSLNFGTSPSDAVALVPLGDTAFAAVARVVGTVSTDVLVNRTQGWSFAGSATPVDSGSEPVRGVSAAPSGNAVQIAWAQGDGSGDGIRTARVDAASIGAPVAVSHAVDPSSASGVRIAADASGNALAVWDQQHLGRSGVFWAYRQNGTWTAPQLLALDARSAAVSSSGSGFMAAWVATATSTTAAVRWQRFSEGAWVGTPATLTSGSRSYMSLGLASDRTGYALAFADYSYAPYGTIFDGATWSTPLRLNPVTPYPLAYKVTVAGRPGEYLFAWIEGSSWFRHVTRSGSAWSWSAITQLATDSSSVPLALADGPNGFLAVYFTTSNTTEARIMTSGTFGTATTLRTGDCSSYGVASNGSGYLVASGCSRSGYDLQSVAFDGSAWRTPRTLRSNASVMGVAVASDGAGYMVLADGWTGGGEMYAVALPEPIVGAIGAPVSLGASAGDAEHGAIVGFPGAGFVAGWKESDVAGIVRIYAAGL